MTPQQTLLAEFIEISANGLSGHTKVLSDVINANLLLFLDPV
jgi:hypothetical protein